LVVAGIALRRLRTRTARAALARAKRSARIASIPALTAEVENACLVLNRPAARLLARGKERLLLLEEVETLLESKTLIVDACRHVVRDPGAVAPMIPAQIVPLRLLVASFRDQSFRRRSGIPYGPNQDHFPKAYDRVSFTQLIRDHGMGVHQSKLYIQVNAFDPGSMWVGYFFTGP